MKKRIFILIGVLLAAGLIGGGIYLFSNQNNKYDYTIEQQRWLESNKNSVIDMYMPSDIPVLTMAGEGLFFDFINYFTKNTEVKINPVAYQLNENVDSEYSILLVADKTDNDIEILKDNYVIITKNNVIYNDLKQLASLKIGYLKDDGNEIASSLGTGFNYVAYNDKPAMLNALKSGTVDAIIGLKSIYLNDILTNNYHISYQILNMKRSYVLRINGSNKDVNGIIEKEYAKFEKNELKKDYNKNLLDNYVKTLNISEKDMTDLNSKTYTYGYLDNGIYDKTSHNTLTGTNYFLVKDFASFANIDMKYADAYDSLSALQAAVNDNKIDFYFDTSSFNIESASTTVRPVETQVVLAVNNNNKIDIKEFSYLKDKKIAVIKNSKIEKYFIDNQIKVNSYNNYHDLFKKANKDTIIAMELGNYEYYKIRDLSNFHVAYILPDKQDYGFVVNEKNKIFMNLLNFYLEYTNVNSVINIEYANSFEYEGLNIFLFIAVLILSLIIIIQCFGRIKKTIKLIFKRRGKALTKDEKLKYIDNLTSLKNRAYLNDNIEKWDDSEIYPQIIIIVDLNNIAYINDNFGHEEGDKVITEAANILIQTQMPNTEIIRTDGNEFLIYMVEYEEKKAVSYIRKLNSEFKNLSHEFGAAIGYSIINDAIKTIDDAVNEATLDMRTNKELMNGENK